MRLIGIALAASATVCRFGPLMADEPPDRGAVTDSAERPAFANLHAERDNRLISVPSRLPNLMADRFISALPTVD
jgi:hypothetical protein